MSSSSTFSPSSPKSSNIPAKSTNSKNHENYANSKTNHFFDENYVILVKNLPLQTTIDELLQFLFDNLCNKPYFDEAEKTANNQIFLLTKNKDLFQEMLTLNKIQFYPSSKKLEIYESSTAKMGISEINNNIAFDGIVKMRGLPYSSNKFSVIKFLKQLELDFYDIYLPVHSDGRCIGKVFIQFKTCKEGLEAITKLHHRKFLDTDRYVELYKSNNTERRAAMIYEARNQKRNPYKFCDDKNTDYKNLKSYGGLNLSDYGSKIKHQIESTAKSNEKYRPTYS